MNLPTTIVSIVVASAMTVMGMNYAGEILPNAQRDSEAARLMSEGQQVADAVTTMLLDKGIAPDGLQANPVAELRTRGYLNSLPGGGRQNNSSTGWRIDYEKRAVMTPIGSTADTHAVALCQAARRRLELPDPDMIYSCSGADAPGGHLGDREPCCINTGF